MPVETPTRDGLPAGLIPNTLAVERVLYEAEAPILFLTRSVQGQLLLGYLADENVGGTFITLTPVTQKTIDSLEAGVISVREALESAPAWLHWRKGDESKTWALESGDLSTDYLPQSGTPLLVEHEPVLRTRAIGPTIIRGRMPASVVAFVADSTRKALKTILDYTLDARSAGRPKDEHRTFYDLPVQSFAFASFELSFGLPDEGLFTHEQIKGAAEKLSRGLNWASGTGETKLLAETDEERAAILSAVLLLTPPSSGIISQVDVSGSWISSGKVKLTQSSRRRVREALKPVEPETAFLIEGRLGEIDVDKLTFILRDTNDQKDRYGSFAEELLDDMVAVLRTRVVVAGIERHGKLTVIVVVPATETYDSAL